MTETGRRMPRMHARPPMIFGSNVIRSNMLVPPTTSTARVVPFDRQPQTVGLSAGREQPHRPEVDLLVAPEGGVDGAPAPGERRRVEDAEAEARAGALQAPELVEDVGGDDLGAVGGGVQGGGPARARAPARRRGGRRTGRPPPRPPRRRARPPGPSRGRARSPRAAPAPPRRGRRLGGRPSGPPARRARAAGDAPSRGAGTGRRAPGRGGPRR